MPEIDREMLDRAVRWCAESGRPTRDERVRAVLEPLGWDELLAVKATLADPPPGRNLTPADLVALSRATPPPPRPASRASRDPAARASRRKAGSAPRPASAPRIRRMQDLVAAPAPGPAAPLPHFDGLFRESGRAEIGRLTRRLGANRVAILSDLASRWSARDGGPPGSTDLDRLLEHHGLARGFAERERALLLHAVAKHGGVLIRMARELGMTPEDVRRAIDRLELRPAVESIREARTHRLERKATLSERARLLDEEADALADLGVLAGFEADLRRRLPDHLRALSVGGRSPSAADLGRSLSLSRAAVDRLVTHFALKLRPSPPERPERSGRGAAPRRPGGRGAAPRRPPGSRPPPRGSRRPL